jgi:hypothetical protein
MAVEARRGCGFRKIGGTYLVSGAGGVECDRLPIPLTVCPCCGVGIKQARGWTWIDPAAIVAGVHPNCADDFACPLCMAPHELGKSAGLLWIGEKFYKTPEAFEREAGMLGISRRIASIPRNFKVGETWILLAHPKSIDCQDCRGASITITSKTMGPCPTCEGAGRLAGIFHVWRPQRIEKIFPESARDSEEVSEEIRRGITPVFVPDHDPDHAPRDNGEE